MLPEAKQAEIYAEWGLKNVSEKSVLVNGLWPFWLARTYFGLKKISGGLFFFRPKSGGGRQSEPDKLEAGSWKKELHQHRPPFISALASSSRCRRWSGSGFLTADVDTDVDVDAVVYRISKVFPDSLKDQTTLDRWKRDFSLEINWSERRRKFFCRV